MSQYISSAPPLTPMGKAPPLTPMGQDSNLFTSTFNQMLTEAQKEKQQAAKEGDVNWEQNLSHAVNASLSVLQNYMKGKASRAEAEAARARMQQVLAQRKRQKLKGYLPYIAIGGGALLLVVFLTRKGKKK